MRNPIIGTSLFITPDSIDHLEQLAESMTNSAEAWRMVMFTMNYCRKLVQEELDRKEAREEELIAMRFAVAPRRTTEET